MTLWDPQSVTDGIIHTISNIGSAKNRLTYKYKANQQYLDKLVRSKIPFRNLGAATAGTAAIMGAGRALGYLPLSLDKANILICSTLSAIVDNECNWVPKREMAYLSQDKMIHYVYDIYRYQNNKYLGNQPPFDRSVDSDPVRFRGAFYNGLTGRSNYEAVLPDVFKMYEDKVSNSWLTKLFVLMPSSPSSMKKIHESMTATAKVLAKTRTVGSLSDEDITELSNDPIFSMMVLFVYMQNKVKTIAGCTLAELAKRQVSGPEDAIAIADILARANGYPKERKVWEQGGFTPSKDDISVKAIYIYATTQLFT